MTQTERLERINQFLLTEMPQYQAEAAKFGHSHSEQFRLFRFLVNVRPPIMADTEFLRLQDVLLQEIIRIKGITDIDDLAPIQKDLYLWQGDITTLAADAIVNAANSGMTGCYCPCHRCIDNAIHTFAGVQLRLECSELIKAQGHEEPTGGAKITKAYNLPCKHILHTVGPIVTGGLTRKDERQLADCYRSCLALAEKNRIKSIAFCCISTGEFHFPNRQAAEIAIRTIKEYKAETDSHIKVIFNVFKDEDYKIYLRLLGDALLGAD